MRDHERKNVTRPVYDDAAVTLDRESRVALKPSTRRSRVSACGVVNFWARRLDGSCALSKLRSLSGGIGTHDDCRFLMLSKYSRASASMRRYSLASARRSVRPSSNANGTPLSGFHFDRGIASMRHQQLERIFASCLQMGIVFDCCSLCRVTFDFLIHLGFRSTGAFIRPYMSF